MELAYGMNRKNLEDVFRQCLLRRRWHDRNKRQDPVAAMAVDLAKKRDSRILRALHEGSEILYTMSVEQFGARGLSVGGDDSLRVEASEYQTWRNAHFLADMDPSQRKDQHEIESYRWQILTAAWLAYGGPSHIETAWGNK